MAWRWTDPAYALLPDDALRRIRTLSRAKAHEACRLLLPLADFRRGGLVDDRFESWAAFDASGDERSVRERLSALGPGPDVEVIVAWPQWCDAVRTDYGNFCTYWQEFCYPSSDDVLVWPFGDEWTVYYQHSEFFMYGMRR
jgi:hypothetical protein